jgi:hypothetical protein
MRRILLKAEQPRIEYALDDGHFIASALAEHNMENPSANSPDESTTSSRSALAERLKQDSRERVERGKQAAADQVEQLADALDDAGSRLNDGQPTLASYATRLANGLDQLAQRLRNSSLEDLARDTRSMATRNPGAYLLGSAAVGLLLARFLKASIASDERSGLSEGEFDSDTSRTPLSGMDAGQTSMGQGIDTAREPASTASRGIH